MRTSIRWVCVFILVFFHDFTLAASKHFMEAVKALNIQKYIVAEHHKNYYNLVAPSLVLHALANNNRPMLFREVDTGTPEIYDEFLSNYNQYGTHRDLLLKEMATFILDIDLDELKNQPYKKQYALFKNISLLNKVQFSQMDLKIKGRKDFERFYKYSDPSVANVGLAHALYKVHSDTEQITFPSGDIETIAVPEMQYPHLSRDEQKMMFDSLRQSNLRSPTALVFSHQIRNFIHLFGENFYRNPDFTKAFVLQNFFITHFSNVHVSGLSLFIVAPENYLPVMQSYVSRIGPGHVSILCTGLTGCVNSLSRSDDEL